MTRSSTTLEALDIDEADIITFDFTARQREGEEIVSAVIDITVLQGVDTTPDIKDGTYSIVGMTVLQKVAAANRNVTYHIRCIATTTLRKLVLSCELPVVKM